MQTNVVITAMDL